jgi:hypothetical protein
VASGFRRKRADMRDLDAAIRRLYELYGWGARKIAAELGDNYAIVGKRMARMSLKVNGNGTAPPPTLGVPFRLDAVPAKETTGMQGSVAMGQAISWFLSRGYTPSLPFTAAAYDLVVESEEGLKRVQVKFTSVRNGGPTSSFIAAVHRKLHKPGSTGSARENAAYTKADTDLFFIVTSDGDLYLIPIEAVGDKKYVCLDVAYSAYRLG